MVVYGIRRDPYYLALPLRRRAWMRMGSGDGRRDQRDQRQSVKAYKQRRLLKRRKYHLVGIIPAESHPTVYVRYQSCGITLVISPSQTAGD